MNRVNSYLLIFPFLFFLSCADRSSQTESSSGTSKKYFIEYLEGEGFTAFDAEGKKLFTIFPYDNGPDYTSEGLFRIIKNGKIGYANESGEIIISPRFDAALPFHSGLAGFCEGCVSEKVDEHSVWSGGLWGFINKQGIVVIPAQYDKIMSDFEEGFATVEKNEMIFQIDSCGNKISP